MPSFLLSGCTLSPIYKRVDEVGYTLISVSPICRDVKLTWKTEQWGLVTKSGHGQPLPLCTDRYLAFTRTFVAYYGVQIPERLDFQSASFLQFLTT